MQKLNILILCSALYSCTNKVQKESFAPNHFFFSSSIGAKIQIIKDPKSRAYTEYIIFPGGYSVLNSFDKDGLLKLGVDLNPGKDTLILKSSIEPLGPSTFTYKLYSRQDTFHNLLKYSNNLLIYYSLSKKGDTISIDHISNDAESRVVKTYYESKTESSAIDETQYYFLADGSLDSISDYIAKSDFLRAESFNWDPETGYKKLYAKPSGEDWKIIEEFKLDSCKYSPTDMDFLRLILH